MRLTVCQHVRLFVVATLLGFLPSGLLFAESHDLTRLRSGNPAIASLIADADSESTTFRKLVEELARTDGLVYVETGRCGHGVRACVPHSMALAGRFRLLHILLDPHDLQSVPSERLAGLIAHELRHALELLSDPAVTNDAAMFMFYRRDAPPHGAFETAAATLVGDQVSRELSVALGRSRLAAR